MLTKVITMRPGAEAVMVATFELDEQPTGKRLREIILPQLGPGRAIPGVEMERVAVLYEGKPCDMFVDENGHAKGLAYNALATAVYHNASKSRGEDMTNAPVIVGPAVLFNRRVWF